MGEGVKVFGTLFDKKNYLWQFFYRGDLKCQFLGYTISERLPKSPLILK